MAKLEDYFKDPKISGKLMSLITPESGFGNMHIESDGKASALFVDNTPVIYFDGNTITEMYLPDVKEINEDWLPYDVIKDLRILEMPNLEKIGYEVALGARKFVAPKLKQVGDWCSGSNLQEFDAPALEVAGDGFLRYAENLKKLNVPNLRKAGGQFLTHNLELEALYLPKFEWALMQCLPYNQKLSEIYAPNAKALYDCFMECENLEVLDLPSVTRSRRSFPGECPKLRKVNLPKLIDLDDVDKEGMYPPLILQAYRANIAAKEKTKKMQRFKQSVGVFQSADDANKKTSSFIKQCDWNR